MKAVVSGSAPSRVRLGQPGWEQPLRLEPWSEGLPTPLNDQVLLRVQACGVCHRDLIDRAGRFPFMRTPITPGHEAAGRVIAVGPDVTEWRVGDRVASMHRDACGACSPCKAGQTSLCSQAFWVLGLLADGAYATHLLMPQSGLYASPESLSSPEAAVLHCTFGTAYRDLVTLGGLRVGERVLVTGANGGVGAAAVQIASRLGAEVIAVLRSARHADFVRGLGASQVIVDDTGAFHERSEASDIDLALEAVGVDTFHATLRCLRTGGRVVVVGNIRPERFSLNLGYLITRGIRIQGGSGATREDMAGLLELHARAPLHIAIDRTLPLWKAEEAQRLVQAGGLRGRVALVPGLTDSGPSSCSSGLNHPR